MSRIDNRHDHEPLCRLCVSTIELLRLCVHRTPILYTCRRVFLFVCPWVAGGHACIRTCTQLHTGIHAYMHACLHNLTYIHTYILTYILTYVHTYIQNYTGIHARTNNEFATVTCMSMLTHPQMYIHIHNLLYACLFAHMLTKLHGCVRLITPAHKHNLSRSFVRSGEICTHTHTISLLLSDSVTFFLSFFLSLCMHTDTRRHGRIHNYLYAYMHTHSYLCVMRMRLRL